MNDEQKMMFKSVIDMGQTALRFALYINAGAAIVMLAFIGYIFMDAPTVAMSLTNGTFLYSLGMTSACVALGTTYVAQYCYAMHTIYGVVHLYKKLSMMNAGYLVHAMTAVLVIISYTMFIVGSYLVYVALN